MGSYFHHLALARPPSSHFVLSPNETESPYLPAQTSSPFYISPSFHSAALHPAVPITIGSIYATSVHYWNSKQTPGAAPYWIAKTRAFFHFVILHNVFLATYSGWTFWEMSRAVSRNVPSPIAPKLYPTINSLCNLSPLWHEALSFYGFLFYLSKFYEVVDTLIILLKGKKSSTLQTYHHTGAMLAMWSGIRYQSPPIWMFVWFNSGIHTLMYTYYTLSTLGVRVPKPLKQSLTTLQISQFLIGSSFATTHLFVDYFTPTPVPNTVVASSPTVESWLSRLLGTSDKVAIIAGMTPNGEWKPCLKSSGETFAVLLNVAYLAPLTYLFVAFFIASYTRKGKDTKVAHINGAAKGNSNALANGTKTMTSTNGLC